MKVQLDTGMTQEACEVGLGLTIEAYDRLAPQLESLRSVEYETVGRPMPDSIFTAVGRVSIDGLDNSEIQTRIARIDANILGVCFFHRLPGFELVWDLTSRTMTIRSIP
jgi:hypothetical protein